jgi:hypothetical protein
VPLTDPSMFCCLCITQKPETEHHLFWDCDFAKKLWAWLTHIIYLRTGSLWCPQLHHALLRNRVPRELQRIQTWWELLRGSMIWFIWVHQNALIFRAPTTSTSRFWVLYTMSYIPCIFAIHGTSRKNVLLLM